MAISLAYQLAGDKNCNDEKINKLLQQQGTQKKYIIGSNKNKPAIDTININNLIEKKLKEKDVKKNEIKKIKQSKKSITNLINNLNALNFNNINNNKENKEIIIKKNNKPDNKNITKNKLRILQNKKPSNNQQTSLPKIKFSQNKQEIKLKLKKPIVLQPDEYSDLKFNNIGKKKEIKNIQINNNKQVNNNFKLKPIIKKETKNNNFLANINKKGEIKIKFKPKINQINNLFTNKFNKVKIITNNPKKTKDLFNKSSATMKNLISIYYQLEKNK